MGVLAKYVSEDAELFQHVNELLGLKQFVHRIRLSDILNCVVDMLNTVDPCLELLQIKHCRTDFDSVNVQNLLKHLFCVISLPDWVHNYVNEVL